jgi:putative ABC transport system permease protein
MAAILIVRYFSIHFSILLSRKGSFDGYDQLKI